MSDAACSSAKTNPNASGGTAGPWPFPRPGSRRRCRSPETPPASQGRRRRGQASTSPRRRR
eukprot:9472301-Pyramimonas_sp.AAC.1